MVRQVLPVSLTSTASSLEKSLPGFEAAQRRVPAVTSFENRRPLAELVGDNLSYGVLRWLRRRATRKDDLRRIVAPIDDVCGLRLISTGRFELTQLDAIRTLITSPDGIAGKTIDPRGLFIDVGANIGIYTMALSQYFDSTIAFEASPLTF